MAIIQKRLILEGSKGKEEVLALFDTGASYSFIRPELAVRLEIVIPLPKTDRNEHCQRRREGDHNPSDKR